LAQPVLADATPDPEVLQIAAVSGRVLVTRDVQTMPRHFKTFIAVNESPGLILIQSRRSIAEVIDGLLFAWVFWPAEEMRN